MGKNSISPRGYFHRSRFYQENISGFGAMDVKLKIYVSALSTFCAEQRDGLRILWRFEVKSSESNALRHWVKMIFCQSPCQGRLTLTSPFPQSAVSFAHSGLNLKYISTHPLRYITSRPTPMQIRNFPSLDFLPSIKRPNRSPNRFVASCFSPLSCLEIVNSRDRLHTRAV